jgi:large subunit ribosomal protein L35
VPSALAKPSPAVSVASGAFTVKPLVFVRSVGHKNHPPIAELAMPKVKTHSGAKKRFKRTATGKFKFAHVFKRHLLTGRTKKRKRQARNAAYVPDAHHHQIALLLPYKE